MSLCSLSLQDGERLNDIVGQAYLMNHVIFRNYFIMTFGVVYLLQELMVMIM